MAVVEYKIEVDELAIGLTQSPVFMGVNNKYFFGNFIFCTLVCLDAHTVYGVPLFVVVHLLFMQVSRKEPNFLTVWGKAFIKTPPVLNSWYWGKTNSYGP